MTWGQRYRLQHTCRTSLVLWATVSLFAALVAAPLVRWLDHQTGWVGLGYSPDGARAVLGVLVGSMLTFIVFVLSATLIVVQLASGQSSPRVIAMVLATPWVKVPLALLTFSYTFSLAALGRIEDRVPHLLVGTAVLLNLISLVVFFQFVHHLSTGLRPGALIQLVAERALRVIADIYPLPHDANPNAPAKSGVRPATPSQVVEYAGQSGVVMAFSAAELVRLAAAGGAVVEMLPQVGDFIADGDPLFRVFGDIRPIAGDELCACVAVGPERTLDQDPRFVFRILVYIANKALSPAINDPTTAVLALDQIEHLLVIVGRRDLDKGQVSDREGTLRLLYHTPDWSDFVMLAVSEVRQFGAGSIQVGRRLHAMLEHLTAVLPESRRPPLDQELTLLGAGINRSFDDEEDRRRACTPDFQGMGGSESRG
jgi:uncharacterized membrane protein